MSVARRNRSTLRNKMMSDILPISASHLSYEFGAAIYKRVCSQVYDVHETQRLLNIELFRLERKIIAI